MIVAMIIAMILLAAAAVYCALELIRTRKKLETANEQIDKERTALVEYKKSCYCKEIA